MNIEQKPATETNETLEQQFVRLFKEKGADSLEVQDCISHWEDQQELLVEQETDPDKKKIAGINLNLNRARLYWEAGMTDNAIENFNDALLQATNERMEGIISEIETEMDKLGI